MEMSSNPPSLDSNGQSSCGGCSELAVTVSGIVQKLNYLTEVVNQLSSKADNARPKTPRARTPKAKVSTPVIPAQQQSGDAFSQLLLPQSPFNQFSGCVDFLTAQVQANASMEKSPVTPKRRRKKATKNEGDCSNVNSPNTTDASLALDPLKQLEMTLASCLADSGNYDNAHANLMSQMEMINSFRQNPAAAVNVETLPVTPNMPLLGVGDGNGIDLSFDQSPGNRCANCETTETVAWRRDEEGKLTCNACGLYSRIHNTKRPKSMQKEGIRHRVKKLKSTDVPNWSNNAPEKDGGEQNSNINDVFAQLASWVTAHANDEELMKQFQF